MKPKTETSLNPSSVLQRHTGARLLCYEDGFNHFDGSKPELQRGKPASLLLYMFFSIIFFRLAYTVTGVIKASFCIHVPTHHLPLSSSLTVLPVL